MRGFQLVSDLNREFAYKGTASREVVFIAEGGLRFNVVSIQTEDDETLVMLEREAIIGIKEFLDSDPLGLNEPEPEYIPPHKKERVE